MKNFFTRNSNKELVDAFMKNPTFNSVVTLHEIEGSSYDVMLEDAVVRLVSDLEAQSKQMRMILESSNVGEIRFAGGGSISFSVDRDEEYVGSSESLVIMPID